MPFYPPAVPPVAVTTGMINADAVTNAKLANEAANTLKGNLTGSSDNPADNTLSAVSAALSILNYKAGAALTDADVTKNPASDKASVYTLPAATLTGAHILTLGVTGTPVTKSIVTVVRRDLTANTYTVKDDAAATLIVFGASPGSPEAAVFSFDGTHYVLDSFSYIAA